MAEASWTYLQLEVDSVPAAVQQLRSTVHLCLLQHLASKCMQVLSVSILEVLVLPCQSYGSELLLTKQIRLCGTFLISIVPDYSFHCGRYVACLLQAWDQKP